MRKIIIPFLMGFVLILCCFSLSSCTSTKNETEIQGKTENVKRSINPIESPWKLINYNKNSGIQKNVVQWSDGGLKSEGVLVEKWSKEFSRSGEDSGSWTFSTTPNSIVVSSSCYIQNTNEPFEGLLDPKTGEIIKDTEGLHTGPTDGEYVFGDSYRHNPVASICWRLKDRKEMWDKCCNYTGKAFVICSGALLHCGARGDISRLDASTGNPLWTLEPNSDVLSMGLWHLSGSSDRYVFIQVKLVDDTWRLYRIDPKDGQTKEIVSVSGNIADITVIADRIYCLANDNRIISIDENNLLEINSKQIAPELASNGELSRTLEKVDKKIAVRIWSWDDKVSVFYLFDPGNFDYAELDASKYRIVNECLFYATDEFIKLIDPESLKIKCYIDCKNLVYPFPIHVDKNGILVLSKDKLTLFGPK